MRHHCCKHESLYSWQGVYLAGSAPNADTAVESNTQMAAVYNVSHAYEYDVESRAMLQLAGGPHIPLRYGRVDAKTEEDCAPEGRLPGMQCQCTVVQGCALYLEQLQHTCDVDRFEVSSCTKV